MFAIWFTPQAHRSLHSRTTDSRKLITRLLCAVAQMAEHYPAHTGVWARLGRVTDRGLEIEVEGQTLRVQIDYPHSQVKVVGLSPLRLGTRRMRRTAAPPNRVSLRQATLRS